MNKMEIADKQVQVCFTNDKEGEVILQSKTNKSITKSFFFDSVYGPKASQKEIYTGTILPIVEEVLEGYNCTIFAYGQTGTGKTYTMEGPKEVDPKSIRTSTEAGIITRSINTIFERLSRCTDEYSVKVSHLEVYNEELCDLLNPDNKGLKIFEDTTTTVHNLTESNVENADAIFTILEKSWNERKTAETNLNKASSRSHCIFTVTIHIRETTPEGEELLKIGKLNLVDLAGSENVGKSGARLLAKTEAGMINKSLLTLGRVITALTEHSSHIPYRESKLTRLLQDSLGGRTKTCIIATITPASSGLDETLSTLDYAFRAKNIRNQPQVNKKVAKREVLREYTSEITDLRAQLEATRKKEGVYLPVEQYEKLMSTINERGLEIETYKDTVELKNKELDDAQEILAERGKILDKTKAELDEVTNNLNLKLEELKDYQEKLAQANKESQDKQIVILELRKNEETMHEQAKVVYENLNTAITDVDGLYKKIGRQEGLMSTHNQEVSNQRELLLRILGDLQNEVKNFVAKQSNSFINIIGKIENFASSKEKEFKNLEQMVVSIKNDLTSHIAKLDHISRDFVRGYMTTSDKITQFSNDSMQKMEQSTQSLLEINQGSAGALQQDIRSLQQNSRDWYQLNSTQISKNDDYVQQFVQSHNTQLSSTKKDLSDRLAGTLEGLNTHESHLRSYLKHQAILEEKLKEMVSDQLKTFTTQMNEMIKTACVERNNVLNNSLTSLLEEVKTTGNELTTVSSIIESNCNELECKIDQYGNYQKQMNVSFNEQLSQNNKSITTLTKKMEDQISLNVQQNVQHTLQLQNNISQDKEQYNQLSTNLTECTKNYFNSQSQYFKDYVDYNNRSISSVQQNQATVASSLGNTTTELRTDLKDAAKTVEEFLNSHSNASKKLTAKVDQFKLMPYTNTQTTPAKHPFTFPLQLSKTRSNTEIISTNVKTAPTAEDNQENSDMHILTPQPIKVLSQIPKISNPTVTTTSNTLNPPPAKKPLPKATKQNDPAPGPAPSALRDNLANKKYNANGKFINNKDRNKLGDLTNQIK
uniref:Kinesin motor domain-containing protein n=1 Tax=Arcella intermedia TaxID=1963864 RepID=A0A6B2KX12_9EUKA